MPDRQMLVTQVYKSQEQTCPSCGTSVATAALSDDDKTLEAVAAFFDSESGAAQAVLEESSRFRAWLLALETPRTTAP